MAKKQAVVRMLAKDWAVLKFGDFAPTPYALRRWIERGDIQPAPECIEGKWFVLPTAEYRDRRSGQYPS